MANKKKIKESETFEILIYDQANCRKKLQQALARTDTYQFESYFAETFDEMGHLIANSTSAVLFCFDELSAFSLGTLQSYIENTVHVPVLLLVVKECISKDEVQALYNAGLSLYLDDKYLNKEILKFILFQVIKRHDAFVKLLTSERKYRQFFKNLQTKNIEAVYAPETEGGFLEISETAAIQTSERAIEALKKASYYDFLTQIPNRMYFEDALHKQISRAKRLKKSFHVGLLDIDDFKRINDTYGHDVGDLLLKEVANRLQKTLRGMDVYARLGGDEFAIMLTDPDSIAATASVARRIIQTLSDDYLLSGKQIHVTVSMGVAAYDYRMEMSFAEIMKHADLALYQAKERGKNQFNFYAKDIDDAQKRFHDVEAALSLAIKAEEFYMVYQPIIDLNTHEVAYLEALIRWDSSMLKAHIPPDEFISIAENSGHILSISKLVLKFVCQTIRLWLDNDKKPPPVAINFSVLDLMHDGFINMLEKALDEYQLEAFQIHIELTETTAMENHQLIKKTIDKLRALGFGISIDDFGTGYSSLARLREMSFDSVKIDRAFIVNMIEDSNAMQIVHAVLELTKQLGIVAIAEGVEKEEEVALLKEWKCTYAQGYYFSKPLKQDAIMEVIEQYNGLEVEDTEGLAGKIMENGNKIRKLGHDINNQLAGLLGYSEITLVKLKNVENIDNHINAIEKAIESAIDVVNRLSVEVQEVQGYVKKKKMLNKSYITQLVEIAKKHGREMFRSIVQIEYSIKPMFENGNMKEHDEVVARKYQRILSLLMNLKTLNEKLVSFQLYRD
ncbi:putative bifunctional diguanylate cyclase/phosphodiesterase [Fangia hongkongensis]|uniref:putative bifunctional diguanylate cyclase/phosphodiesterase n=3 Tax=Fangia hongkongensis TaxID=270495 RepID=UPI00037B4E1D|nr:EAL domain-containing protein [Fangia hongkongensis]